MLKVKIFWISRIGTAEKTEIQMNAWLSANERIEIVSMAQSFKGDDEGIITILYRDGGS